MVDETNCQIQVDSQHSRRTDGKPQFFQLLLMEFSPVVERHTVVDVAYDATTFYAVVLD